MALKIIVASGKGGVGKTSATAGLAIALSELNKNVLVMDFDVGLNCLDFILSSDDTGIFTWGDIIDGNCEASGALRKTCGPMLLVAPACIESNYTVEEVKKIIDRFDNNFDYIFFDAPAGVSGGFELAAKCADCGIIVSTPDDVCTRVASYAAQKLDSFGVEELRLIINRFDKKETCHAHYLNIDEVINAVSVQLIGVIPEDINISHCGVTGMHALKNCPAKQSFYRISKRIIGYNIPLKI